MSYIIPSTNPLINLKITEKGREKLSQGALTFSYWGIGDSEVNYDREEELETNSSLTTTSKVLRPKDDQPNIKYFLSNPNNTDVLEPMTQANINNIKAIINNKAEERGMFSGNFNLGYSINTGSEYNVIKGSLDSTSLVGGKTIDLPNSTSGNTEDFVLLRITNDVSGDVPNSVNTEANPHLWYKIEELSGTTATLDRELPSFTGSGATMEYYIYPSGEVYESFGSGSTTAYWNSGTLSFDVDCCVTVDDIPVWNMNQVWGEDLAGMSGNTYENYINFGSYDYLGTKNPYLEYDLDGKATSGDTINCEATSEADIAQKAIAIFHYTNNGIGNYYGEFFYINGTDNKLFNVHFPTIMYHRNKVGTSNGVKMGVSFVSDTELKTIPNTTIEYYDLIEDYTTTNRMSTDVLVVGRVFPQLKTFVIHDEEVLTALSYKSNRNWTLPTLEGKLSPSLSGTTNGILEEGKTIYLTYMLTNDNNIGLTSAAPCQKIH